MLKPIDYANIRQLTENMRRQISQGTVDAPSWEIPRSAKCAASIYATLGTRMSLGDYVRLVKAYIDVFWLAHAPLPQGEDEGKPGSNLQEEDERIRQLCADLKVIWAHISFVRLTLHRVGISRSTGTSECQRRQDQATIEPVCSCLPGTNPLNTVSLPRFFVYPWSTSVNPRVLDDRILCPQC